MAQQSTTEPREAPKQQGKLTREQQKRVINKQEQTRGTVAPLPGETLAHAAKRYPKPGPGNAYTISRGDRSIQRGTHDRGDHYKSRSED
ncbi:MAG TPA: hypothetical protein VL147_12115 [Devosia sp.]|nr:hypothetical protein [Devosia sp.]